MKEHGSIEQMIKMIKMLLILMTLASVATANDAKIKALMVGTWSDDCGTSTTVYKADGTVVYHLDDRDEVEKWVSKTACLLRQIIRVTRRIISRLSF
jgi:hypothetical protein